MADSYQNNRSRHDTGSPDDISRIIGGSYQKLRSLADRHLRGERIDTSDRSDLVQEILIRLLRQRKEFTNEEQFMAVASIVTVQIIRDLSRRTQAKKRMPEGGIAPLLLEPISEMSSRMDPESMDRLADALDELRRVLPRTAEAISLRHLHGVPAAQVADHLGISSKTVYDECRFGKVWLLEHLNNHGGPVEK